MTNAVEKPTPGRIGLGDDMDEFVLILDPSRRVKTLGGNDTEQRKNKNKAASDALAKDVSPGKGSKSQGDKAQNIAKPPTPAIKKALDKYHADMRKLAEDSMPVHRGLRVPCEDWFCSDRGSASFGHDVEP